MLKFFIFRQPQFLLKSLAGLWLVSLKPVIGTYDSKKSGHTHTVSILTYIRCNVYIYQLLTTAWAHLSCVWWTELGREENNLRKFLQTVYQLLKAGAQKLQLSRSDKLKPNNLLSTHDIITKIELIIMMYSSIRVTSRLSQLIQVFWHVLCFHCNIAQN